ncbi:hypothetical protein ACIBVM_18480 [[Kitasatospora] papulosa]|uniref:hypothetical protein n=1 Tax=[Kitasatospora] papulosa TaxID=1464011 RepID=UPI00378EE423
MGPTPKLSRLQADVLAVMQEYERNHAAELNLPTVARLHILAEQYDRATAAHATEGDVATVAAEVAEELSLAEAGTIRRAAKAVELGMPGIICRARAADMEPNEIARQLGATGSYVRRILRRHPALLAEARARAAEEKGKSPADTSTVPPACCAVAASHLMRTGEQTGPMAFGHSLDCPTRAT